MFDAVRMGERIHGLRAERRMSYADVADYLYLSERQYIRYECGQARVAVDCVVRLALLFNVSTDYLLGLES